MTSGKNGRVERHIERKYKEHDLVFLLDNGTQDWWKPRKHLLDIYAEKCGVTFGRAKTPYLFK